MRLELEKDVQSPVTVQEEEDLVPILEEQLEFLTLSLKEKQAEIKALRDQLIAEKQTTQNVEKSLISDQKEIKHIKNV
jgi:hypothetical protein